MHLIETCDHVISNHKNNNVLSWALQWVSSTHPPHPDPFIHMIQTQYRDWKHFLPCHCLDGIAGQALRNAPGAKWLCHGPPAEPKTRMQGFDTVAQQKFRPSSAPATPKLSRHTTESGHMTRSQVSIWESTRKQMGIFMICSATYHEQVTLPPGRATLPIIRAGAKLHDEMPKMPESEWGNLTHMQSIHEYPWGQAGECNVAAVQSLHKYLLPRLGLAIPTGFSSSNTSLSILVGEKKLQWRCISSNHKMPSMLFFFSCPFFRHRRCMSLHIVVACLVF